MQVAVCSFFPYNIVEILWVRMRWKNMSIRIIEN